MAALDTTNKNLKNHISLRWAWSASLGMVLSRVLKDITKKQRACLNTKKGYLFLVLLPIGKAK